MTYRIECLPREAGAFGARDLEEYGVRRRWWEIGNEGVSYADTDTELQFDLEMRGGEEGTLEAVVFALPEGAPEVYGREIGEELEAFAAEFEVELRPAGVGDEPAEVVSGPREAVEAWGEANRRAIRAQIEEGETSLRRMDREDVQEAWRWNRARQRYHRDLEGSVFVPRVVYFEREGRLERGVIWPDAIPLALPEVEMLLVSLTDPSLGGDADPDAYVVDYEQFREAVESVAEPREEPVEHLVVVWQEAPTELIEELIAEAEPAEPDGLEGLAADRIFERDVIEELRD